MKNLDLIANELFNKVRGRFPTITIGDEEGKVINQPGLARYFDFDYVIGEKTLGKVSISLDEDNLAVMYGNDLVTTEDATTKDDWYSFLKELRVFAKKRLLNFDVRNIMKNNLNKRDYKFLAQNRPGEVTMESTMYGTSRKSYQEVGNAKLVIQHARPIEEGQSRIRNIGGIFIENDQGERFKYPYKHLNGARAMARHVAEGGTMYDQLGQYIVGLSEELNNLKKFKTYMGRSKVMAEGLKDHLPTINERIQKVKKTIETLQKESGYHSIKEECIAEDLKEVPADLKDSWVEQLTVKQFDESLADVFPYIYKLIATETVKMVNPEDLLGEAGPVDDIEVGKPAETYKVGKGDTMYSIYTKFKDANFQGRSYEEAEEDIMRLNPDIEDPALIQPGQIIQMPYFMGAGPDGASRGLPTGGFDKYGEEIESGFEEMMGQFAEGDMDNDPQYKAWLKIYNKSPDAAEAHPKHAEFLKYYQSTMTNEGIGDFKRNAALGDNVKDLETQLSLAKRNAGGWKKEDIPVIQMKLKDLMANEAKEEMCPEACCGKPVKECSCGPDCPHCDCYKKNKMNENEALDEQLPVTEFVLSMYDRNTGQFPKGETAVLTAVEKDYGEQYINPAKAFIEAINAKFEEINGYKETFESQMQEALQAGDEKMLMDLYNTYKDNKMIPKKYRDLMGRVKDELGSKKEPTKVASKKPSSDLDAFGGPGPDIKPSQPKDRPRDGGNPGGTTIAMPDPVDPDTGFDSDFEPDYNFDGSEVKGKSGMQSTAYDPDYSGPEGYRNDAEAIEKLMSKPAMSSEESLWLNMAYRKYGITKDNLGKVLKDIRTKVAKKAAADVKNFDKSQESVELENILRIAGL